MDSDHAHMLGGSAGGAQKLADMLFRSPSQQPQQQALAAEQRGAATGSLLAHMPNAGAQASAASARRPRTPLPAPISLPASPARWRTHRQAAACTSARVRTQAETGVQD